MKDLFAQVFSVNVNLDRKNVLQGILNYDTSINKSAQIDSQRKQAKRKFDKALELEIIKIDDSGVCELG